MVYTVKKFNKYHAEKKTYNGVSYHSGFEAEVAFGLDMKVKAKKIKGWKRQVKLSLDVNDHHICNYYIDFVVTHLDKTREYIEVKGFETPEWRLKWKLTEALLPKMDKNATLTIIRR
jgi:hypothetical protein